MERMLEGSGSAFNIARVALLVCRPVHVRSIENNRLVCRFMTINWVSDSILVSAPRINTSFQI